ncbi:uncharacterized protein BJ171DRAFT_521412 [Polychytrium aggregatum]|uniref:uncharacterized protein n=1 Tax=Polychytrium aggregatum TaxID=110093 RepID=UPI0022FDEEE3|nr:uncharacterized protein BJ171DRAFT_521412 [Polychytrium aggregatum]KAI9197171.1 hypothetical protein BJ171DRAFT_521412 [Polychytrium aggregatum]
MLARSTFATVALALSAAWTDTMPNMALVMIRFGNLFLSSSLAAVHIMLFHIIPQQSTASLSGQAPGSGTSNTDRIDRKDCDRHTSSV